MTEPEQPEPPDLDAARLRLDVAVQQLIQPSTEKLNRDRPEHHPDAADIQAEHDAEIARLQRRLRDQQSRRDHDAMTYTERRIEQLAERARARTVQQTQLPSLIDLLQDELAASTSRGGAPSAGATRSLLALPIAELLGDIRHTLRTARPAPPRHAPLAEQLRAWNQNAGHWRTEHPDYLAHAADQAEKWVHTARTLLNPPRTFGLVGECPACGHRTAHVRDDTGEWIRKDALQVSYADETARCVRPACGATWPREKWGLLGGAITHDQEAG